MESNAFPELKTFPGTSSCLLPITHAHDIGAIYAKTAGQFSGKKNARQSPGTVLKLRVKYGGGGGSRTRVRKSSIQASTYLAQLKISPCGSQLGRAASGLTRNIVSHHLLAGEKDNAILLVDISFGHAGKDRQDASHFMRLGHTRNRLRLL